MNTPAAPERTKPSRQPLSVNLVSITYGTFATLMLPVFIVGFMLRSLKLSAYRRRLNERLGYGPALKKRGIIVHGASVGEIISLSPFIESVLRQFDQLPVTVTSFTPTGSAQIKARFGDRVQHCYIPIDAPICVSCFLDKLQPQALILMETEIWPSLIKQCSKKSIKILLINGRISERSYPRYKKIRALISQSLQQVDVIQAQSQDDADRFIALGASAKRCRVSGNIKYDLSIPKDIDPRASALRTQLGARKICVLGSTHQDEEELILDSLTALQAKVPELLFVIAPRHPERYMPLREKAGKREFSLIARSDVDKLPQADDLIWLIDTMGELLLFYRMADICIVAGSFGLTGGHNPIEPALFAKPIIVGPHTKNFKDATENLMQADGIVQLKENTASALSAAVQALCEQPQRAAALGENAYRAIQKNRGATLRALDTLEQLINDSPNQRAKMRE